MSFVKPSFQIAATLFAFAAPATALAYEKELGLSISPAIAGMPAIADEVSQRTLGWSAGGGLGFEYNPTKILAVVIEGGYLQALSDSLIGTATIQNRQGQYYFQQSTAFGLGGLRLTTPAWWMPIQLGISVEGGFAILWQSQRDLQDHGISFGLTLPDAIRPEPMIAIAPQLLARVYHQIRIDVAPTLFMLFAGSPALGFGLKLSLTFLFYP